jgi:SOS-response transcriptional repressor LexA
VSAALGGKWGSQRAWAEKLGVTETSLSNYIRGKARPPVEFLSQLADQTGVSLDWLLLCEGPKLRPDAGAGRRIPILGRVPAGPSGGGAWDVYDAPDVYDAFDDGLEPDHTIALRVMGESMFPTLWDGDLVVVSVNGQSWRNGDLVIAEIEEHSEDYLVKRLGQDRGGEITLLSDNFLHYDPLTFPSEKVEIRGSVVRVVRTPTRQSPHQPDTEPLVEFYQSPHCRS